MVADIGGRSGLEENGGGKKVEGDAVTREVRKKNE